MPALLKRFNRLNLSFLLFLIACANYLGFKLYGGEEQYFAFAKQFMNPDWIPNSFTLTHPAGGNLLFEVIAGFALRFLSFEQLAFFGRLLNFALLSVPLAKIFRHFKLSNIESAFLFQLIFLPHQSLFAGEWIFQNFEVKTLSYIFILYAVYYLLQEKIWFSVFFAAIGTWFHFLVGGWFFLIALLFFMIQGKSFGKIAGILLIYGVIVLPFVVYLAGIYFIHNPTIIEGINTNWIYCYQRLPFHLGIFKNWPFFADRHLDGILISLVLFLLCIFYFRRFSQHHIRILNTLNIILFTQQFIFIGIALFDRNGVLLKTYPFRTSTLSSLFILIELALIHKYYLCPWLSRRITIQNLIMRGKTPGYRKAFYAYTINTVFLAAFLLFLSLEINETIRGKNTDMKPLSGEMKEIMCYIREETDTEDVILLLFRDAPLSFHRFTERESFVVWKFIPTRSRALFEIYDRQIWKQRLAEDISLLGELTKEYRLDYLVSPLDLESDLLQPIKKAGNLTLFKVLH
jgi:hypothetical protein